MATGNVIIDDNGSGSDVDPDGDSISVTEVNAAASNVGAIVAGSNGGTFTIQADGEYTFATGTDFDFLIVGDSQPTSVTYTISDGEGGTDTATVTITVLGSSAPPTNVGTIPPQTGIDSGVIAPLDVTSFFDDVDATDVLTYTDAGTLPPGLSLDPNTGVITGTLDSSSSVGGPYTVSITATDLAGQPTTQTFTWDVTNPAPVAEDNDNSVAENGPTAASGDVLTDSSPLGAVDTDPDGDTLTVTNVAGTPITGPTTIAATYGTLNFNPDGTYTYDLDLANPAVSGLNAGDTMAETFSYTIDDGNGGTDTAVLTITIIGENDVPTTVGTIGPQAGIDGSGVTPIDASIFFADTDSADTLTFSDNGTLPPGITIDPTTGIISGTHTISSSNNGPYAVVVTATDTGGATTTQTFTWDIANPAPIAVADTMTTDQNTSTSTNVMADNGAGIDSDPDGDALTVAQVNGDPNAVGSSVTGTGGGTFVISSDGTTTFDPSGDFDALDAGQTATTTVTYTITDDNGGTSTTTLTVTVTGTNDAPQIISGVPDQVDTEGQVIVAVDISTALNDPEGETVTFDDGGTLPPGLTLDPTTGVITGTPGPDTSVVGTFPISITATDASGNPTTLTFNWQIQPELTFAFDSLRNEATDDEVVQTLQQRIDHNRAILLSEQIEHLAPEPILAGYASPGSVLIGRMYDASGSIIGETNLTVGPSGNWVMHFFGTAESKNTRVVIEHIATENVALGSTALKLTTDTYRALQLDASSIPSASAATLLDGTASETLDDQDRQNQNPLGLQ